VFNDDEDSIFWIKFVDMVSLDSDLSEIPYEFENEEMERTKIRIAEIIFRLFKALTPITQKIEIRFLKIKYR